MMANVTVAAKKEPQNGYDIDVYGLSNGTFYGIHIPAIICISGSFICAVTAFVLSFKRQSYHRFFTHWSKSERFIVYLALCDGLFNVSHFTDHLHIAIARNHVYPLELCEFYGFTLAEFITAQNLMVNIVAINAFMLIFFDKNLDFGCRDWKLITWTFGAPFIGATIAGIAGQLGPNGSFCYFDGVKGKLTNIFFTTVPLLLILVLNTVLYIMTWKRIRDQTEAIKQTVTGMPASMRASHRAARAMSMFVIAFFIQWWAMGLYGIWGLFDEDIPQVIFHFVTTFSNIGGILNLIVYFLIKRRQLSKGEHVSTEKMTHSKSSRNAGSRPNSAVHSTNVSMSDLSVSNNEPSAQTYKPPLSNDYDPNYLHP